MGDSAYKIGDFVTIKKLNYADSDLYRFGLNDEMVELSGKSLEIKDVEESSAPSGKLPDDGCLYKLEGGGNWSWASSMFEGTIKKELVKDESININAFIKKKKCPVLDFTLH